METKAGQIYSVSVALVASSLAGEKVKKTNYYSNLFCKKNYSNLITSISNTLDLFRYPINLCQILLVL